LRYIGSNRASIAVKHDAARRWQEAHVYAIFFGQKPEFFGLLNLKEPHAGTQSRNDAKL
jgi:hypothetical protein